MAYIWKCWCGAEYKALPLDEKNNARCSSCGAVGSFIQVPVKLPAKELIVVPAAPN